MRTTLYADAPQARRDLAFDAADLTQIENTSASKRQRNKKLENLAQVS
jgi:hypothetical protein